MCRICESPQRREIEAALAGGMPERAVAKKFGFNRNRVQAFKKHGMVSQGPAVAQRTARRIVNLRSRLKRLEKGQTAAERAGKHEVSVRFFELIGDTEREIEALQASAAQPAKSEQPRKDGAYVAAIRQALGFTPEAARGERSARPRRYSHSRGELVRECDPLDTCEQLRGLALSNPQNEKLLAACARVICFLERQTLPADLQDRMETLEADFDERDLRIAGLVEEPEREGDRAEPDGGDGGVSAEDFPAARSGRLRSDRGNEE